ncbi:MAG: hypothetical protein ACON39_02150 [Coraliomargaritaceae bacterium]
MRWLFKTLWLLLVVGLFALTLLPYSDSLLQTYQDFTRVWSLIRNPVNEEETLPTTEPRTQLALPVEEINQNEEINDAFLEEIRERAATDPQATLQWILSDAAPGDRLRGMLEVVALWAADDSPAALLWLEENATGIARGESLHLGISLWSQNDPLAAADWIEGMANDPGKSTATNALIRNWATTRPEAATAWVNRMPGGPIRRSAATALVDTLVQTDPFRAAQWAFSEAIEQDHPELLNRSIAQWAQSDPQAAENYLRQIDAANTTPDAVQTYLRSLTQQDPYLAANWLFNLSPENSALYRNDLNSTLLEEWSQSDSIAASNWLGQADPGPARDAAIVGFATAMIEYEPAAVAEWTNVIDDPETRSNWLTQTIQTWSLSDPQNAREWLLNSEIEPNLREQLTLELVPTSKNFESAVQTEPKTIQLTE